MASAPALQLPDVEAMTAEEAVLWAYQQFGDRMCLTCSWQRQSSVLLHMVFGELGLNIPGDVSVAGFGEHPMSRLLAPPLTSTAWDVERVAELAAEFLVRAIAADGPQATLREVIAPAFVARSSI